MSFYYQCLFPKLHTTLRHNVEIALGKNMMGMNRMWEIKQKEEKQ